MEGILVTGASGGIGCAIARKLAFAGYKVGVCYLSNADKAASLAKEIGGVAIKTDVTDYKSVLRGVERFAAECGNIVGVVNNAGVALPIKPVIDTTEEEFDKVFAVNVKGVYNVCKAIIPHLLNRGGNIVNVSSMWGISGASCEALYSATKSAIIGFTKSLAKEYSSAGIRVNAVAPGFIDTAMNAALSEDDRKIAVSDIPLGRVGTGDDVADAVLFLIKNGGFITGTVLNVSGGEVI